MSDFTIYYGIGIITLLITLSAQILVNTTYSKYKKQANKKDMSGSEAAREILDKNGLKDIYVVETRGVLTDHYDPSRKVVRLSSDVFHKSSISAIAIAAHECGHAIQDKENYTYMKVRAKLVPFVNFSTYAGYIALTIGLIASSLDLIWLGIILEAMIIVFQLVTLPVEFDASRRALKEVEKYQLLSKNELEGGKKVLTSAALTYVASLATAILEILRLILIYGDKND